MTLKNITDKSLSILTYAVILLVIYAVSFVATCYRPEVGAIAKLKQYLYLNNIQFDPGISSRLYIQPNYYGKCGVLLMAGIRSDDSSEDRVIIYKLHRFWFFGDWNIVDVIDDDSVF
jgi:hypothetical protein